MINIAVKNGGECLSKIYINNKSKLLWRCREQHSWFARPDTVIRGVWCRICRYKELGNSRRGTIKKMRDYAKLKHGKCLSVEYVNSKSKLKWQCERGHSWDATPASVINRTWCPYCRTNVTEEICRHYFEGFFEQKFPRIKPSWLTSNKGTRLELDGFCSNLKLAFEYHGLQHFIKNTLMATDNAALRKRKTLDSIKREKCKAIGITLVEIPYTIEIDDLKGFILEKCKKLNVKNPSFAIKSNSALLPPIIDKAIELAKKQNGKCLSKRFVDSKKPLKWACSKGHVWPATFNNVSRGSWCPTCAGREKKKIGAMKAIAIERGGRCLSKSYVNLSSKMKWECGSGHKWLASYDSIRKGSWCLVCSKHPKLTLKDMRTTAKERNGKCLSKKYRTLSDKLKWECDLGHLWMASGNNVRNNKSWCPVCARGRGRKTTKAKRL